AGGSIGREICLQIARWAPSELVLLGHGENSIFESLLELQDNFPSLPMKPLIADIRDLPRMMTILKDHHPQVLFHAAAHKHVPLMEANVEEAVTNNIIGTRNVVETAVACGVERLVLISSDKAIRPVSVMGATKRVAEMIILDAAFRTGRAYSIVRFGNVLGSRGSVVPLFKRQIAHGGPVTITHPDMKRYFMTIPEAVHLVLQAAAMGQGRRTSILLGSASSTALWPRTPTTGSRPAPGPSPGLPGRRMTGSRSSPRVPGTGTTTSPWSTIPTWPWPSCGGGTWMRPRRAGSNSWTRSCSKASRRAAALSFIPISGISGR
ncbi:MAG: polysaccharide biosynthesis protein, partial [Proteobacteria bacterium]|nr:polysaccharide biosynthesis protein [Pseudomonadota bacterium]